MRFAIAALAAASVAMTGCTTNPYSGDSQVAKGTYGALIGGVAGCAIGIATTNRGSRGKDCLKGGAIGGVVGGGVGVYMDVQEKKLRDRLQGVGVGVQRDKTTGIITLVMPGNITFPTAQSSIRGDFYNVLNAVADVLKEYKDTTITVNGYTDSVGSDSYNLQLSQARADSVAAYLSSQGVDSGRLSSYGLGKANPIAGNSNEAGRSQNRRVEVKINPPQQQQ